MFTVFALLPLLAWILHTAQGKICNSPDSPCCSEYGYCGDGYFCLGGCNPLTSYSLSSCSPSPVCQSANYIFSDTSRILTNSTYFDGNASEYDWVLQQGAILPTISDGEAAIALTLTESGGGSLLSSTRYIHYGRITTRMKTGRWTGVVAAFITMSGIKDEIDWEFPGNHTTEGQTNYFWQGYSPTPNHGATVTDLTDTYTNWHDYTIDWRPDSLTFLVDGNVIRTIQAADCVNNATGVSEFPNTPSRIQLSLWAAGVSSQSPGIIAWSGGLIDWSDPDYVSAGHFSSLYQYVSVECHDPTTPDPGTTSYVYGSNSTLYTPSIAFSNQSTVTNAERAPSGASQALLVAGIFSTVALAHTF